MVFGLYKNKYRLKSARLPDCDYSRNDVYFVTICTLAREKYFGDVFGGKMHLNGLGMIIADEWQKSEIIRKYVRLDEWVVMPDHFHGLLAIEKGDAQEKRHHIELPSIIIADPGRDAPAGASPVKRGKQNTEPSTQNTTADFDNAILAMNHRCGGHRSQWKSGSLGAIINQFKMQCTKRIRRDFDQNFTWQTRFYDSIVQQEDVLSRVREYILDNPAQWEKDKNNIDGLYR